MKSRFAVLVLALLFLMQFAPLFSQEEEEEPLPPPSRPSAGKIGGAGGFTPLWLFWNVNALNEFIPSNAGSYEKSPMVLLGGQGYAYVMLIENLRVGGMGAGGSSKTSMVSGPVRRDLEIGIGMGGVTVEYAIPVFDRLDIVPGIMLGGGSMEIKMIRDGGGFKTWQGLWSEFELNSDTRNVTRKMEGSFFVYQPSLQIEFALLRWVALRAGVSYVGMSNPSWKLDDQFDVAGVPSKIRGSGWMLNTGVFLGTFLF